MIFLIYRWWYVTSYRPFKSTACEQQQVWYYIPRGPKTRFRNNLALTHLWVLQQHWVSHLDKVDRTATNSDIRRSNSFLQDASGAIQRTFLCTSSAEYLEENAQSRITNHEDHSVPLYMSMTLIFSSNCANKILYIRSTLEYRIITPLVQAVFSPRNNFSVDIPSKDPLEVGGK